MLYTDLFPTPCGAVFAAVNEEDALVHLTVAKPFVLADSMACPERLTHVKTQLAEYFAGTRRDFDLLLAPIGTPFQQRVWNELRRIPYGGTATYGALAKLLGNPNACRAVGRANGANKIWIVIPCHRIIGANGLLTGYAGGLSVKERLLSLEEQS